MDNAVIVQRKRWWDSKMVWFNVIYALSLLGEMTAALHLPQNYVAVVSMIVAGANIILRVWFTGAPVTDAGAAAAETGPVTPTVTGGTK